MKEITTETALGVEQALTLIEDEMKEEGLYYPIQQQRIRLRFRDYLERLEASAFEEGYLKAQETVGEWNRP